MYTFGKKPVIFWLGSGKQLKEARRSQTLDIFWTYYIYFVNCNYNIPKYNLNCLLSILKIALQKMASHFNLKQEWAWNCHKNWLNQRSFYTSLSINVWTLDPNVTIQYRVSCSSSVTSLERLSSKTTCPVTIHLLYFCHSIYCFKVGLGVCMLLWWF